MQARWMSAANGAGIALSRFCTPSRVGLGLLFIFLFSGLQCSSFKLYPLIEFVPKSENLNDATVETKVLGAKEIKDITKKLGVILYLTTPESSEVIKVTSDGLIVMPILVERPHSGILKAFVVVENQSEQPHEIIMDSGMLENQGARSSKVFRHNASWAGISTGEPEQSESNTLFRFRPDEAKISPYSIASGKTVLLELNFEQNTFEKSILTFTIIENDTHEELKYGFRIGKPIRKSAYVG